jgi:hypothetical protein
MKKLVLFLILCLELNVAVHAAGLPYYLLGHVGTNEALPAVIVGNRAELTGASSKIVSFREGAQGATSEVAYIDRNGNLAISGTFVGTVTTANYATLAGTASVAAYATLAGTASVAAYATLAGTASVAASVIYTPSASLTYLATQAVIATRTIMNVAGTGGAVTLTVTPEIVAGTNGQLLILRGTSDTNTLTFQSYQTAADSGLMLAAGQNFTLGAGDKLTLIYDSTLLKWVEAARSHVSN